MGPRRGKVLVIGFDALDHELLAKRNMPAITLWPLLAPIPITGPSWTSIYTGDSMARHNVRDVYGLESRRRYSDNEFYHLLRWHIHNLGLMLRLKPPLKRYATYETTESKYLWDTLGEAGITVKMVNMPITCPARRVNGMQISGFPIIKRKQICYPAALADRIPADYPAIADIVHWFSDPERDSHSHWSRCLKNMGHEEAKRRIVSDAEQLAQLFLELPTADVEMVQFSFIDRMGHGFGISGDIEDFCYSLAAELVEKLVAGSQPATTVILSDHGFKDDDHADLGCFAVGGELVEAIKVPTDYTPSVLDVAPTLGSFLAAPHPCEGNDLTAGSQYVTRYLEQEQKEKEQLKRHLTDLGYF